MSRRQTWLICAFAFLALLPSARAQTTLYFNNANGDWNTSSHWNPAQVPTNVDTAYIRDSRIATIAAGAGGAASNLNIGVSIGGGGNTGTLNVNGVLAIASGMMLAYGHTTWGSAWATVNQGTNTAVTVGGNITIGGPFSNSGNGGVYRVGTNASLCVTGNVTVAGPGSADGKSSGGTLIQLAGSTVDITGSLYLGNGNATYATGYGTGGVCSVAQSATLRLKGASSSLYIGYGQNSRGTLAYNSTNGTLCIPGSVVIASGDGTWGHSAGTLALGPGSAVAVGGNLTAGSSYSSVSGGGAVNIATCATLTVTGTLAIASGSSSLGSLNAAVGHTASGLILNGGALSVGNGSIAVTFVQDPAHMQPGTAGHHTGVHHGLKWTGNHTNDLIALGSKLAVDDSMCLSVDFKDKASIFYDADDNATYVGFYVYEAPISFSALAVSNVTTASAEAYTTLNGSNADVCLVWDTTDRGMSLAAWGATNSLGAKSVGPIDGAPITGLASGTVYTCRFFGTNSAIGEVAWSMPATFGTKGPPVIATLAESGLTYNSAVLNGNVLSTGGAPTTVRVYWARTDQHPGYTGWLGTNDFGTVGVGTTNCIASSLAYNTAYVYRYYATNVYGEAWGSARPFTTPFPPAQTLYFNNADGDWNTAGHWSPTQVPIEVDTAHITDNRIATIAAGASGVANNLNIAVDGDGNATGTLNVNGTLAVGAGGMTLASGDGTWGSAKATVDQGTGSVVTVGGGLTVGSQYSNTGDGGLYRVGTNASLSVIGNLKVAGGSVGTAGGTLLQLAGSTVNITSNLYIGNINASYATSYGTGGVYTVAPSATLRLNGASSSLYIGYEKNSRGTLTYNSTNGTLNILGSVTIASGDGTWGDSAGTLNQGAGTAIAIGGSLTVGSSYSHIGDGGLYLVGTNASLSVTGDVKVATGNDCGGAMVQSAGSAMDITGNLYLGNINATYATSYGTGGVLIVPPSATLRLKGASSSLYIGYEQNSRGTLTYNSTNGTLNIPGSVTIASGDGTWGHSAGTLALGPGSAVAVGGNLTAGGSYSSVNGGGMVNIATGATLTVAGTVAIASGASSLGAVTVAVGHASSGLILNGSTLSVGNGGIAITFMKNPSGNLGTAGKHSGIHYGLKWAGDHVADLAALGPKLTVDDTTYLTRPFKDAATCFYDAATNATFVGFYINVEGGTTVVIQ